MGSLYKNSLSSMFETPIIAAAREIRKREEEKFILSNRELDIKEQELALRKKELELELLKIKMEGKNQNNINKGIIYDDWDYKK